MAFKMKGSPYKLGSVATKSALKNYKNPQDYKVFNMGNEPTPMKQGFVSQEEIEREQEERMRKYMERKERGLPGEEIIRGTGLDTRTDEERRIDQEKKDRQTHADNTEKGMVQLSDGTWRGTGWEIDDEEFGPLPMKSALKQVPLQPAEHEDTHVYDGDDKKEIIADLEDRIGFIKEDMSNTDGDQTEDQRAALELLNAHLEKLYKEEGYKPE